MKVLVSGGSGLVGRYIVNGLLEAGHDVAIGGRTLPPSGWFSGSVDFTTLTLDPDAHQPQAFEGVDAFIHAAFDHLPGKYRGGEGDDPEKFLRLNVDGSVRLFETAKAVGVTRAVFLSSRAVYGGLPESAALREDAQLQPTSLYGVVKLRGEEALANLSRHGFVTASLRLTGVYGGLRPNKWGALMTGYLAGRSVSPRVGTEVHGADVASAVRLMLEADADLIDRQTFNVSDVVTDHAEILAPLQEATGCLHPLPPRGDVDAVAAMLTDKISALGWRPGGKTLLRQTLTDLAAGHAIHNARGLT